MKGVRKATVVGLFAFLNFLNGTDRYAVAGLLQQISKYYDISDSEAGLLQTVYIVTYVISAPIFGYMGDRFNRKWVLLGGSLLWIVFILASSFIPPQVFGVFLLFRAFSGVGDAAVNTLVPSIIGDIYSGKGRSYSLMVFYYSVPFGWSASVIVASQIIESNTDWQWGLRVVPPFAIASIILLAFLLQEPERREIVIQEHTVWFDFRHILRVKSFLFVTLAVTAMNIVTGAQGWWNPTMVQLAMNSTANDPTIFHGQSYSLIQSIIGIMNTAGGIIGTTISVWVAELWNSSGLLCLAPSSKSVPWVGAASTALAFCSTIYVQHFFLIDINWYYVLSFYGSIMAFGTYALTMNVLLKVIPSSRRAIATAVFNTFASIFGDAPAPFVVGKIADALRDYSAPDQDGDHLQALLNASYLSNAFMAVCTLCFVLTVLFIERDEAAVEETEKRLPSSSSDSSPSRSYSQRM